MKRTPTQPGANSPPLVSIGLPVYNGAAHLREALDSLLAQTHHHLELIISDNGSCDATPQICQEYARKDPRIRYHRQVATLPAETNFNFVLQEARADFFMWAAHDDLWNPAFVSQALALLQSEPQAALAFCAFRNFGESAEMTVTYPRLFDLPAPTLFLRLWRFLRQKERDGKANAIYGLMRRQAILAAGGFRCWGDGSWGADMLVVFRLLSLGNLVLSRELLFHKRRSESGVSPPTGISRPPAPPTASEIRSKLRAKTGYLKGYARILKMIPELNGIQRFGLRLLLAQQFAYAYWREITQALIFQFTRRFFGGRRMAP